VGNKEVYELLWANRIDGYRRQFHKGGALARAFIKEFGIEQADSVCDWGCGQGRLGEYLYDFGCTVDMVDIAHNSIDQGVHEKLGPLFRFHVGSIADYDLNRDVDWSISTDVLEHLTIPDAMSAVENISLHTEKGMCLRIATRGSMYQGKNGEVLELHRTIRETMWWKPRVEEAAFPMKLVDTLEYGGACAFIFKGWIEDD